MIPFYDAISNKAVSPYAELLFYYMYYIHVLYFSSSTNNANICHINVLYPRLILHYCINIHEGSKCLIAENQRYFLNYTEYRVATHRRNGTLSYVSNHLYISNSINITKVVLFSSVSRRSTDNHQILLRLMDFSRTSRHPFIF